MNGFFTHTETRNENKNLYLDDYWKKFPEDALWLTQFDRLKTIEIISTLAPPFGVVCREKMAICHEMINSMLEAEPTTN